MCGRMLRNTHARWLKQAIGAARKRDKTKSRLVSLDPAVFRAGVLAHQVAHIAHAVPSQATIQPSARSILVKQLSNHSEQVIQRHQ
jgi:hypothetical protein